MWSCASITRACSVCEVGGLGNRISSGGFFCIFIGTWRTNQQVLFSRVMLDLTLRSPSGSGQNTSGKTLDDSSNALSEEPYSMHKESAIAFQFDILNKEREVTVEQELQNTDTSTDRGSYASRFITRDLLPTLMNGSQGSSTTGLSDSKLSHFAPSHTVSKPQWTGLNFCPAQVVTMPDVRLFQQQRQQPPNQNQPQQVKKSRRGPRSKSSQYRGVTFYRRTGRWESHIWLVSENTLCFHYLKLFFSLNVAFHFYAGILESKFIWVRFLFYFEEWFNCIILCCLSKIHYRSKIEFHL